MQGQIHSYEGFDTEELTFPVRIIRLLGIELLILTNASGGLNPEYGPGEIAMVRDHIY